MTGGNDASLATWSWSGSDWQRLVTKTEPAASQSGMMTWDAASRQLIYFGGETWNSSFSNQTWSWTGNSWLQLRPATSPPHEVGGAMSYDPSSHVVVLFWGPPTPPARSAKASDATWQWNGKTWDLLHPARSPGPRTTTALAYYPDLGGLLLFGGESLSPNGDAHVLAGTWKWTGSTWVGLASDPSPPALSGTSIVYDPSDRSLIMFGGSSPSFADTAGTWSWQAAPGKSGQ